MKSFVELYNHLKNESGKCIAAACAHDREVLLALREASEKFQIRLRLFGKKDRIRFLLEDMDWINPQIEIRDCPDDTTSALEAVKCVHNKEADILMKGFLDSGVFLKAVLHPDFGLRVPGKKIATVAVMELEDRFLFITDPGFTPVPDVETKKTILIQAAEAAVKLGVKNPKAAVLSASESVNPKIVGSQDAQILKAKFENGEIINCVVDGPVSLDIAVSKTAAEHKGYKGYVRGDADILLVPSLEAGNILYKSLVHFARIPTGGIVTGASAPVIFTSRSDSAVTKFNTIAFACALV